MKKVVGSEEWVSLSELQIPFVKARVHSGAKTSSLHATNIQAYQKDIAQMMIRSLEKRCNYTPTTA